MDQYNMIPFYSNIDILQNHKSCISCTRYISCNNYDHYLDVCTNFKHYITMKGLESKTMKPKPKVKKSIYIDTKNLSYNNEIHIECANDEACEFIEDNAYLYGKLIIWQRKETKTNNIQIYNLRISKVFGTNEVINYLL